MCTYKQPGHDWYQIMVPSIPDTRLEELPGTGVEGVPSKKCDRVWGEEVTGKNDNWVPGGYLIRIFILFQLHVGDQIRYEKNYFNSIHDHQHH